MISCIIFPCKFFRAQHKEKIMLFYVPTVGILEDPYYHPPGPHHTPVNGLCEDG